MMAAGWEGVVPTQVIEDGQLETCVYIPGTHYLEPWTLKNARWQVVISMSSNEAYLVINNKTELHNTYRQYYQRKLQHQT